MIWKLALVLLICAACFPPIRRLLTAQTKRAKEYGWRVRRNLWLCAHSQCCTSFRSRSINVRSIIADVMVEANHFNEAAWRLAIWTQNSNISIGDTFYVLLSRFLQTLLLTVAGWVTVSSFTQPAGALHYHHCPAHSTTSKKNCLSTPHRSLISKPKQGCKADSYKGTHKIRTLPQICSVYSEMQAANLMVTH
jgi:hypothetical protein